MYAVAFDLVVADTERYYPKGVTQAYTEIGAVLGEHSFRCVQGSLYVTDEGDMANLFLTIQSLRNRSWFPKSVHDIRAFRIERWSDFTAAAGLRRAHSTACRPVGHQCGRLRGDEQCS